jgi:putative endopeptidase
MKNNILLYCFTLLLATSSFAQFIKKKTSIDTSYMDFSIRPQDNFYQFSNGRWLKNNPVPKTEARWGSMNELDIANKKKQIDILNNAKNAPKTPNERLIGAYYTSYIDTTLRNKLGTTPIQPELQQIDKINSREELIKTIAHLHKIGVRVLFSLDVEQDLKEIAKNSIYISQSGLGLPNNAYYTQENKRDIANKYQAYLEALFIELGETKNEARLHAHDAFYFESKLASAMMSPSELRNPDKTYNKTSRKELERNLEDLNFKEYLNLIQCPSNIDYFIVGQPNYINILPEMINLVPLEHWKCYLKSRVISYYSKYLPSNFAKLNFNFYQTVLSGKSVDKPILDKAVSEITNLPIGEILGQLFVEKHFSIEAQTKINTMVDLLIVSYDERLNTLTWMSDSTKIEARKKLHAIQRKLGFPSKWEDFSKLQFSPLSLIDNYKACNQWAFEKALHKLTQPIDKNAWEMPAHMINAYYQALNNEIVFPAGIMQAPFFDVIAEDAVNYSRIGMIIGHELTHGFDDSGAKFAADGSFSDWWSEEDKKKFDEKTSLLGKTYTAFCPIDGYCVDPQLTMGENIADLGGIILAFNAYKKTKECMKSKKRYGFTPEQRFFIAMAQIYKINFTEQELKSRLANDPHSPGMYRVQGPLMNIPAFFETFDVKEGDKMRNGSGKIVEIW